MDELEALGNVEANWGRNSDCGGYDGIRDRMNGTASGTRRDSKRVETKPLAEYQTGQHEQRQRTTTDYLSHPIHFTIIPDDHPSQPAVSSRTTQNKAYMGQ